MDKEEGEREGEGYRNGYLSGRCSLVEANSGSPYNATRADAEDVRWLVSIGRSIKALRPLSEWRRRDIAPFRVPSGSSLSLSLSINNRVERHPRATKRDPPPRLLLSLWIGRFVKWWLENVKETSSRTSCVSWDKEEEVVVVVCCTPSFSRNGSRVCSTCLDCSWRKRRFQNSCSSKSESGSESGSKFSDISFPFLPLSLFSSPVNWSHLQIPRENSLYRFARIYSSLRHFCVSRSDWDRRSLWPMRFYHRSGPVWINRIV